MRTKDSVTLGGIASADTLLSLDLFPLLHVRTKDSVNAGGASLSLDLPILGGLFVTPKISLGTSLERLAHLVAGRSLDAIGILRMVTSPLAGKRILESTAILPPLFRDAAQNRT
jgi:hypothetical protein